MALAAYRPRRPRSIRSTGDHVQIRSRGPVQLGVSLLRPQPLSEQIGAFTVTCSISVDVCLGRWVHPFTCLQCRRSRWPRSPIDVVDQSRMKISTAVSATPNVLAILSFALASACRFLFPLLRAAVFRAAEGQRNKFTQEPFRLASCRVASAPLPVFTEPASASCLATRIATLQS
jgi:hypothetical protein